MELPWSAMSVHGALLEISELGDKGTSAVMAQEITTFLPLGLCDIYPKIVMTYVL
jgi:hypothetical protein